MNKHVSRFTIFFAMAISFGLIGLGMAGVDITRLANAFIGLVLVVIVGGMAVGFIASLLHR